MEVSTGLLPGGYVDEAGVLHRQVELTPLTGREEELLARNNQPESASLVSAILSRCVQRIGAVSPVSEEVARHLLVEDRQYLLLRLREATFGDLVHASLLCPWPDCGKKVAIHFSTRDIPIRESEDKGPLYTMTLSPQAMADLGDDRREITFRLPTGADQEVLSPLLAENEARVLTLLLGRCIQSIGNLQKPDGAAIAQLSPQARLEIEVNMEAVAPKVELTMETSCPECGREFSAPLNLQRFFFGEMKTSGDILYREVHYLAYHYHWSEREIMEMTRDRRHKYIEVLADEIERLNNAT
jgi:hypothetical protein